MGFPTALIGWGKSYFTDDFNRSNSGTVGNGWDDSTPIGSAFSINSNTLLIGASTEGFQFIAHGLITGKSEFYCECVPLTTGIGPAFLLSTGLTSFKGYAVHYSGFGLEVYRLNEQPDLFAVASDPADPNLSTDTVKLEVLAGNVNVYLNGTLEITFSSTVTLTGSGSVGVGALFSSTSSRNVDNYAEEL